METDPANYAIPDGPAVTFDPDKLRAWLAERGDEGTARAYELGTNPDATFHPDEHSPAFLTITVLDELMSNHAPADVWKTADGVEAQVVETVACEGTEADGGAVLCVDVGGLRLMSRFLTANDLVNFPLEYGKPTTVPHDEIAVQALMVMVNEINYMVEQHHTVRATDAAAHTVWNLGPLAGQLGAGDIETALEALAQIATFGRGVVYEGTLTDRQWAVAERLRGFLADEKPTTA